MRLSVRLAAAGLLLATSGCAALAVGALGGGAAAVAYAMGDVERTYPYPIEAVYPAALAAADELGLAPGFERQDGLKARIERYTATGDRVRITLTGRGPVTEVSVRVNTFGNKAMSRAVAQRIEGYLPQPTLPAAEPVPAPSGGPSLQPPPPR